MLEVHPVSLVHQLFLAGDKGAPGRPVGRIERRVGFEFRAFPNRLRLAGQQIVALDARLIAFEDGKQVTAIIAARLVERDHVPVAGVRLAVGQLRLAVRNGFLLEVWIAERDRLRFVAGWRC